MPRKAAAGFSESWSTRPLATDVLSIGDHENLSRLRAVFSKDAAQSRIKEFFGKSIDGVFFKVSWRKNHT